MAKPKETKRLYHLDSDTVEVVFYYDEKADRHFGDYPDFSEIPRYTPNGRPWVNVMGSCEYSEDEYSDCGSCRFFICENKGDLIGICKNEKLIKQNQPKE